MSKLPAILHNLDFESLATGTSKADLSLQIRAEALAHDYLDGGRLVIFAATLRGPFTRTWHNPWHISEDVASTQPLVASPASIPNQEIVFSQQHVVGFVPINSYRIPLAPTDCNAKKPSDLEEHKQVLDMAKKEELKEKVVAHAISAIQANQSKGVAVNAPLKTPLARKKTKASKYKIQIYEDSNSATHSTKCDLKAESRGTTSCEHPAVDSWVQALQSQQPQLLLDDEHQEPLHDCESSNQPQDCFVISAGFDSGGANEASISAEARKSFPNDKQLDEKRILKMMWPEGCLQTAHEFHGRLINLFGNEAYLRLQQLLRLPLLENTTPAHYSMGNSRSQRTTARQHLEKPEDLEYTPNSGRSSLHESQVTVRTSRRARRHAHNKRRPETLGTSCDHASIPSVDLSYGVESIKSPFTEAEQGLESESAKSHDLEQPSSKWCSSPPISARKKARFSDECDTFEPIPRQHTTTESQNSLLKSALKRTTSSKSKYSSTRPAPLRVADSCAETEAVPISDAIDTQDEDHSRIAVLNPSFSSTDELDLDSLMEDISQVLAVEEL